MTALIIIGGLFAWLIISIAIHKIILKELVDPFYRCFGVPFYAEDWEIVTELNKVGVWLFAILTPIITLPVFILRLIYTLLTIGRK
ncbi:MAG: hypothetical protein IJ999_00955 [Clostridia bacterium]|nr:hypothetical protein [Clostridia bacterium]